MSAAAAFDALAERYDEMWTHSLVGRLQRDAVWSEIDGLFQPGEAVWDLGCGTGADAAWLARKGVRVFASDISPRMQEIAQARGVPVGPAPASLDGVLSNFGVLNCIPDLRALAEDLVRRMRPGGRLVFCVMGRFCLSETAWYLLAGRPRKAFRRWGGRAEAQPGGFPVWYPTVGELAAAFAPHFRLVRWRGIGLLVPPSCTERAVRRFPRLLGGFAAADSVLARLPLLRGMADHRLLILVRT
ncbi:MAG TPA: class I SAM-dependent methyltransferase [Bryobacteraceae bacterium]|nr:class I SAM-dependent methyltransferase [Bryobacteraceae bacterium]